MDNKVSDLNEVAKLSLSVSLRRLCLLRNPVCERPDYRLFVISRLPQLKVLDFAKVSEQERAQARERFGEFSAPSQFQLLGKLPVKEKLKILIEKTTNLGDINRIELLLKTGELSEEILDKMLMEHRLI